MQGELLDVSALPSHGFSHRSPMWWGTLGMMAIEGTIFVLVIVCYFYLRSHSDVWPMGVKPPALLWGTLNLVIIILSAVPNQLAKKAGERYDLHGVRLWLGITLAFGVPLMLVRVFEFHALNVRWDSSAYGSVVWTLLGLHTMHLVTDWFDSLVLEVLFFTGPLEDRRYVDVSENSLYWYFVVLAWIPIYLVIYWGARVV
jgi:heme/copper-type cytochrome/quinol oxidase subunit 3